MSPGIFSQPWVMDEEAYRQKEKELLAALSPDAEYWKQQACRDQASIFAYKTEFSRICTAAIRGDWEPAKERCRQERAANGERIAQDLMRSYQRAVNLRKQMLGMK